jgi:hypothetical protein
VWKVRHQTHFPRRRRLACQVISSAAFDTSWAYEYPEEEMLGWPMVAPAGIAELAGPSREAELKAAIVEELAP